MARWTTQPTQSSYVSFADSSVVATRRLGLLRCDQIENLRCRPPRFLRRSSTFKSPQAQRGLRGFMTLGAAAMRKLIVVGLIVAGLCAAGAIHISTSGNNVEITVDRQRLKAVTTEVVEEGSNAWRSASANAQQTR